MFLDINTFIRTLLRLLSFSLVIGFIPLATKAFYINSAKLEEITTTKNKKEVRSTIVLENAERHQPEFDKLILETTVNSNIRLKDYIMLHLQNLTDLIKQVQDNVKTDNKSKKNEKISNLTIYVYSGPTIEFKDVYRKYNLTGYFETHFAKYIIENGTKVDHSKSKVKSKD